MSLTQVNGITGKRDERSETQKFLDENQYSRNGILRYAAIFGRTYVSVGGETTTSMFVATLGLKKGMKVLDIGCGTGGSAFFMARRYEAEVYGVDLSTNQINLAQEYRQEMEPQVKYRTQFYVEDVTTMEYPKDFFDVIYSRDAIMHIEDKASLYSNLLYSLKPGGKLLVSDYCRGDQENSQRFLDYVAQRNYKLHTVSEYGNILEGAGFREVLAQDKTNLMVDIMHMELDKFRNIKESFISEFSEQDYNDIAEGWEVKVVRCKEGDQAWGLFTASKALDS